MNEEKANKAYEELNDRSEKFSLGHKSYDISVTEYDDPASVIEQTVQAFMEMDIVNEWGEEGPDILYTEEEKEIAMHLFLADIARAVIGGVYSVN